MLVISRHQNEKIDLTMPDGTRIVLTLVAIRGDKARIGIEAPKSVIVDRREITESKEAVGRGPEHRGRSVAMRGPRWTRCSGRRGAEWSRPA